MKKLCMITTISLTQKSFVVDNAKNLHKKCGYDITLICNDDKEFESSLPDYIHFIPVKMARGIDLSAISSMANLIKVFKRERFDMVQYSTPNASCYASIAAKVSKVPIRLYCQWGIRYVGLNGFPRKVFKAIEKVVCSNSTDIRSASRLNKAFAVSEGLYEEGKAKVVGNGGTIGVDTKVYDISKKEEWNRIIRERYNLGSDEFVFGFAGRISADKGCNELITAFKSILEDDGINAKLMIVGPVEDNCGIDRHLMQWIKNSKNVILTGMIDSTEMCQYYSAMNVLVHPTYREGFGMVIQEAGALAVPVITTEIPGAGEVMENGISSVHVAPRSASELKKAMVDLRTDLKKTESLGKNAYLRTKQYYERSIMLENLRLDYVELVGE